MVRKNKDFKIREFHVIVVYKGEFSCGEWLLVRTSTSISEAVKYARLYKKADPSGDYRVLGEFNYEEI